MSSPPAVPAPAVSAMQEAVLTQTIQTRTMNSSGKRTRPLRTQARDEGLRMAMATKELALLQSVNKLKGHRPLFCLQIYRGLLGSLDVITSLPIFSMHRSSLLEALFTPSRPQRDLTRG